MAKISKNARTDRKITDGSKDTVKVITAIKGKTQYGFKETFLHKDNVKDFIENYNKSQEV